MGVTNTGSLAIEFSFLFGQQEDEPLEEAECSCV